MKVLLALIRSGNRGRRWLALVFFPSMSTTIDPPWINLANTNTHPNLQLLKRAGRGGRH
jgi:hypothetical protein